MLVSFYHLVKFIDFRTIKSHEDPQIYTYVETIHHRGGRGDYYEMRVHFKKNEYLVNITEEVSIQIHRNKLPDLYFSKNFNILFSLWDIKRSFRIFIVFLLMSIAFIPWNKLFGRDYRRVNK